MSRGTWLSKYCYDMFLGPDQVYHNVGHSTINLGANVIPQNSRDDVANEKVARGITNQGKMMKYWKKTDEQKR